MWRIGEADQSGGGGGSEWEPIKIPWANSAYIANRTQRPSLLTWPGPHSYQKLLALRTELGTVAEIRIDASKNMCETNDKNRIKTQFMSSQSFHRTSYVRVRETTVWEQYRLDNLEPFGSMT
jgi:hypothetical protein